MATLVIEDQRAFSSSPSRRRRALLTASLAGPMVRIETKQATYVGQLHVPGSKRRLADVLADPRPFLHLTNVTINGSGEPEPFLALNKRFIRTVRIVDEGKTRSAA